MGVTGFFDGIGGVICRADGAARRFEMVKETVVDPVTHEGCSRHSVRWTGETRVFRVESQNSFAGVEGPVVAQLRELSDQDADLADRGEPFVCHCVTVLAAGEDGSDLPADRRHLVVSLTPDPGSEKGRDALARWAGRSVPMRLRGPRSTVAVRSRAAAADIPAGFWGVRLWAHRDGHGEWIASRIDLYPRVDPRTVDDPALPRVLVIGDSISMNYDDAARKALAGVANYHRIEGNGGPSDRGAACMDLWLGDYGCDGMHWDLIQFNHGLHDLKQAVDEETGAFGAYQVEPERYQGYLEQEIAIMGRTGARLMWCTTTPVPNDRIGRWAEGAMGRRKDEDRVFNRAALEVMARHPDIAVNDLNRVIRQSPVFDRWRRGNDVHFWDSVEQEAVGRAVAEAVRRALRVDCGGAGCGSACG